jgi:CubicO group peptidase (beta-lactamase class C family)
MAHNDEMLKNLDDYIQKAMQEWEIPGLAVATVKNDNIIYAKGFGVCELGKKDPVDEHTIFPIGSLTKAFTAIALGLLVQEGNITWDDPVIEHLPGFQLYDPYVTHEITIRDLLCHRSGLPTGGGDLIFWGSIYTREEIISRVRFIQPSFSFRSGFGYSNLMYITAGQIIPAVTGLTWDSFIKQRFFEPLQMTRSSTSVNDLSGIKNIATPHLMIGDQISPIPFHNADNIGPAGSINSSIFDMAQWLSLQLGNGAYGEKQLVEEAIIEETYTPHTRIPIPPITRRLFPSVHFLAYGLGWGLMNYHGHRLIQHTGGLDGVHSYLGLLPEKRIGVVVLTNKYPCEFTNVLSRHIMDAYLALPTQDWNKVYLDMVKDLASQTADQKKKTKESRVKETQPTLPLKEYSGSYTNQLYGDATIVLENNKLILHLSAHPDIFGEFEHWHYDTFLCHWTDLTYGQSLVPFILDGQGNVEEFRLKVREDWVDTLEYKFRRISEEKG